jgi:hypothetical protein
MLRLQNDLKWIIPFMEAKKIRCPVSRGFIVFPVGPVHCPSCSALWGPGSNPHELKKKYQMRNFYENDDTGWMYSRTLTGVA